MANGYKEDIFTQGEAYVSVMLAVFLPVYREQDLNHVLKWMVVKHNGFLGNEAWLRQSSVQRWLVIK